MDTRMSTLMRDALKALYDMDKKEGVRLVEIKDYIYDNRGKGLDIHFSSLSNSLKLLIERGYVKKIDWGTYKITKDGEKEVKKNIDDTVEDEHKKQLKERFDTKVSKEEVEYKTRGMMMVQVKIKDSYDEFKKNLESIGVDFSYEFFSLIAKEQDDHELCQTIVNTDTPEEGCIEFMLGFHTPCISEEKHLTVFDFDEDEMRKYFLFSNYGHIYVSFLLPIYKKMKADGNKTFELKDIEILTILLADFDSNIIYFNDLIETRTEDDRYTFTDLIKKRWNFKLDQKKIMV